MTEKQFEEFVRRETRDYNRPPEVPRDEMWLAIRDERQRRQNRQGMRVVFASPAVRWGLGLAATLVLGIGIGMNLDRTGLSETEVVADAGDHERMGSQKKAYQLAAWQHVGRAEAFLTVFRADARAGRNDYLISNPTRDLLTNTRLLQGSPAYADPRFRDLLDDLELVLMQIVQLEAEADGIEADLVAQGMEETGVLLKLRAAASAEPALTGIQGVL
jgi:hypothetical protein